MTIKEVYQKVLQEAEWHKSEYNKLHDRTDINKKLVLNQANKHNDLKITFLQVAAWLEQTEEINPTK